MAIVTRLGKGSKLTIEEMDNNLLSLETDISGNVSSITSKLDKGDYTGSAKDLENVITAAVTGASGISIVPTSPAPSGTGITSFTATQAGTYTNFGGVVVNANSFAIISRSAAGVFSISQTPFNITTGKILTWSAGAYALGDQVNYLGKDWTANAVTVAGDVPGTSTKWTERLSSYTDKTGSLASMANQIYIDFSVNNLLVGYRNASGVFVASNSYRTTVLIPCYEGEIVEHKGQPYSNPSVCGFDKDGLFTGIIINENSNLTLTAIIPKGVKFVAFTAVTSFAYTFRKTQWKIEGSYINVDDLLNAGTYAKKENVQPFSMEMARAEEFSSNVGFTNVTTGISGIVGAGSKLIYDFKDIDTTKYFRFDMLITINQITTGSFLEILFKNKALDFNGDTKLRFYDNSVTSLFYGSTIISATGVLPADKFQFSVIGHLGNITFSVSRLDRDWDGTFTSTGYLIPIGNKIYHKTRRIEELKSDVLPYQLINYLEITSTNAIDYTINSINLNRISTDVPNFNVNTIFSPKIYNDSIDGFSYPMIYSKAGALSLAQWHHPNQTIGSIQNAELFAGLYNSRIAICFITGNSLNNPTGTNLFGKGVGSSNYGAPIGMKYRKKLMDVSSKLLKLDTLISIGASMGGYNSYAYSAAYPDQISCIVTICAAYDLSYAFTNSFAVVEKAYSSAYVCIADNTGVPTTDTTKWTKIANEKSAPALKYYEDNVFYDTYSVDKAYVIGNVVFVNYTGTSANLEFYNVSKFGNKLSTIPTLMIDGASDSTIPIAEADKFFNYIRASGGVKIERITVAGATHIAPSTFKTTEILDFINKHI
jgi:pimeloyl-ACP methyl ester carboxylesterase